MTRPALILQHGDWGPPGLLAEWAAARGIPIEIHRIDHGGPLPELDGQPFVASLGSDHSPADTHVPEVVSELEFLGEVVAREIPVLGLCYGGQALATVLGGEVGPAPQPELGWCEIETDAPELVGPGPWLTWHYHRFTLPPGARELARTDHALQAFVHGPHLGVQFHPESTIEIVREWARDERDRLAELSILDGEAIVEAGRAHEGAARTAAYELFDAFWRRARERSTT